MDHADASQFLVRNGNVRMAAVIGEADILFPEYGDLIISGNDLSSVRIINRSIFRPAVAGAPHSEMGSHLFRDQYGQFVPDPVFLRGNISGGVGADGELSHGQFPVMEKNIILYISPVFLFTVKIGTGIIDHLPAVEYQLQIPELQSVQINLLHMKDAAGSRKFRRGKHLSHRD